MINYIISDLIDILFDKKRIFFIRLLRVQPTVFLELTTVIAFLEKNIVIYDIRLETDYSNLKIFLRIEYRYYYRNLNIHISTLHTHKISNFLIE